MNKITIPLSLVGVLLLGATVFARPGPLDELDRYDVTWDSPSKDAAGSMPLGNGEVGLNLWVEENGDLQFYLSRSDSLSEISRLLKVGEVRLTLSPNPFAAGQPFRQQLRLREGRCEIIAGAGAGRVALNVFVDPDRPVVWVTGEAAAPVDVKATAVNWRTARRALPTEEKGSAWTMHDAPYPLFESADVFPANIADAVVWYHRNEESVVPQTLKHQGLEAAADKVQDPLLHRTFGGWMSGHGFKAAGERSLETSAPAKAFAVSIAVPCAQTETAGAWLELARRTASGAGSGSGAMRRTAAWWRDYWNRSWVFVSGDSAARVPANTYPLRLGVDSNGQNLLPGYLGRASVYGRALTPQEIAGLAATERSAPPPEKTGLLHTWTSADQRDPGYHAEVDAGQFDFSKGLTLEAWVERQGAGPGRLFDKITAGGSDGFLFDTHPGDTLRLIVGSTTLTAPPGLLDAGKWHHVAATVDSAGGAMRVYLDGKVVVEHGSGGGVSQVTRGYTLQRYVQACGGRGTYPIKFNGGIFTVEPKAMGMPFNADFRNWGDCHWWQNVRHMYHPMLGGGDYEMMDPLFRLYETVRPFCEARSKIYHGTEGSYFPETMTVWGTYSNGDYGWDRTGHQPKEVLSPWWQYAWNQGPELVALMLDRWDYTADRRFLAQQVLPMATSVLGYFDTRFRKDANGRIILDPTQVVETYWKGVINDAPTVAGLNNICGRLCALPERLTSADQRAFFDRMKAACPPVPVEEEEYSGRKVRELAPAEKYEKQTSNCENGELYPIWPFRLYGLGKPGLEEARAAYAHRRNHLDVGWGYDGNCAALLGLTDEAARILQVKCANSNPAYRWPATWGPNFDWLPDQNHGGNLLETAQLMLLQGDGDKIRLLPAWPKTWDVSFKLHAPRQTVVEGVFRKGKLESLKVTPADRRKDVEVME